MHKIPFISHEGQNPPFWGYCLVKDSRQIQTTRKATFKSCNRTFTIIQTTIILKSRILWCGDSQTWERSTPPPMAGKSAVRKANCVYAPMG